MSVEFWILVALGVGAIGIAIGVIALRRKKMRKAGITGFCEFLDWLGAEGTPSGSVVDERHAAIGQNTPLKS